MAGPILNVEGLTLRAQGKLVLSDQSFSLPPTGLTALMGPVGTGKSTLLKWLCRRADPKIYSAEVERADYFFAPLGPRNHPLLYGQKQAQSFEQMMMHFSVHLSSNPALICIDEATADLTPKDSERVMERLATMAQSRALLVVSHNQHHMRSYSDHVMLLAGGCVQEFTPTPEFFEAPRSDAGRQFVGSGWVVMAGVDTPSHHLSHDLRTLPFEVAVQAAGANGRLQEIVKGKLYTYALPHDMREPQAEAAALANAGIDTLVCGQGAAGEAGASLARLDVTTRLLPQEG
ncbi:MAG: ABC transporter ATP-binding protein, partial [Pseudomonadota bacterium]